MIEAEYGREKKKQIYETMIGEVSQASIALGGLHNPMTDSSI